MMPKDGRDQIRGHDAIFFGAVGAPDVPDHVSLWGLRLAICQGFDQYANVRPVRLLPGIEGPLRNAAPGIDWVHRRVVTRPEISTRRQHPKVTSRPALGHVGQPHEVLATETAIFTRAGVTADHALRLCRVGPLVAASGNG